MTIETRSKSSIARRLGLGASAVGAGLAIAVLSAPTASAGVTSISIAPGASFGSSTPYGTGCTYQITAAVDDPFQPVFFSDNRGWIGGWQQPNGGVATVNYTPTQTGPITIEAWQGGFSPGSRTVPINVGTGINLGSSCVVL